MSGIFVQKQFMEEDVCAHSTKNGTYMQICVIMTRYHYTHLLWQDYGQ